MLSKFESKILNESRGGIFLKIRGLASLVQKSEIGGAEGKEVIIIVIFVDVYYFCSR